MWNVSDEKTGKSRDNEVISCDEAENPREKPALLC